MKLNIPTDRANWGKSTRFRPPCKPLLILSVLDMAANGAIQRNFVEPSFELAVTYNRYWDVGAKSDVDNNLAITFLDLENDGIWKMADQDAPADQQNDTFWKTNGHEVLAGLVIDNMRKLQKNFIGAEINGDIAPLLHETETRRVLREKIITTYFSADLHENLMDVALINRATVIYSKELLSGAPVPSIKTGRSEKLNRRISQLGFNSAIVDLYDHRCAICGIKLMTPEGHTAVTATHIVPWQVSRNDHPSNGVALCKICHWSFNNGLLGIGKNHEVIIPTAIRLNGNLPGHLLIFKGRNVTKPKQKKFHPSAEGLKWHRDNILRD